VNQRSGDASHLDKSRCEKPTHLPGMHSSTQHACRATILPRLVRGLDGEADMSIVLPGKDHREQPARGASWFANAGLRCPKHKKTWSVPGRKWGFVSRRFTTSSKQPVPWSRSLEKILPRRRRMPGSLMRNQARCSVDVAA